MEAITYTLPAVWASWLINGDDSGTDAMDVMHANNFLRENNLPAPVSCGDEYFSKWNDYDKGSLGRMVMEYTFLVPDSTQPNVGAIRGI